MQLHSQEHTDYVNATESLLWDATQFTEATTKELWAASHDGNMDELHSCGVRLKTIARYSDYLRAVIYRLVVPPYDGRGFRK